MPRYYCYYKQGRYHFLSDCEPTLPVDLVQDTIGFFIDFVCVMLSMPRYH